MDSIKQETIKDYLLGKLPDEQLPEIEDRLMTNSEFFEELLILEDELIDQYLADKLSPSARDAFETHFMLTPERRQKLRFAGTFRKYVAVTATSDQVESQEAYDRRAPLRRAPAFSFWPFSNPALAYSLAAVLLLAVLCTSWLVLRNYPGQFTGKTMTAVLMPGMTRDEGTTNRLTIPPDVNRVELRLELPQSEYPAYRAVLLADNGAEVWSGKELPASSVANHTFVVAEVPAEALPRGDYRVKLSGKLADGSYEDVTSYSMRVLR